MTTPNYPDGEVQKALVLKVRMFYAIGLAVDLGYL